ncbi:protein TBATA isoform X3 [Malaclemys terrapin pileata]|uniref:protein TBATA isoform X3 n=1 Tax=Malaclemys terrapin pileata TaxID=2991368 RepID=UPI0023A81D3F|nr:protein TBATA isoform X3 [Malaclemys terrapin pileata]
MATEIKNLEPVLQQLETKCISAKEKMEMLRSPAAGPFKGKDITALAGKLKHVALNTPLRFSMEAMRPQSKNNSRFGNLSHHSFFSRHNPHPHRVTHIQGSLSDAWREELRQLAARVSASSSTEIEHKEVAEEPRRATQYSAETGRLIPPSSRATAHHTSQQLCRNNAKNKGKDAALSFQDQELVILELLCQILQTDSLSAIQQWLLTAGQRGEENLEPQLGAWARGIDTHFYSQKKDLVMKMLQTATANLQLEPQSLSTSMDKRLQSQMSQTAVGLSSRGQHLGRNHAARLSQSQKQEPIPAEDKPVHMGTAEVLQFHLSQDGKQNQPDPPN